MPSTYMVDIGRRQPALILANDAKDAAFQALVASPAPPSGVVTVISRTLDGETDKLRLLISERRCRVCGCTENHACTGGCCWMAWDLCSACV